jgi:hypothetical protein
MCADGKQSYRPPTPPNELYEESERRKKEKIAMENYMAILEDAVR